VPSASVLRSAFGEGNFELRRGGQTHRVPNVGGPRCRLDEDGARAIVVCMSVVGSRSELQDLLATVQGWGSSRTEVEGDSLPSGELAIVRPEARRLPLTIGWDRRAVYLRSDAWIETFDRDDPGWSGDALDLAAAVMFGRARARVRTLGGRVATCIVEFDGPHGWTEYCRSGRSWWFRRTVEEIRKNDLVAPIALGVCGRLPSAPWLGLVSSQASGGEPASTIPLDGELDLHTFLPKQVGPVVREYIAACHERGIRELRIVHGKGRGHLRRTVHAELARHDLVASYRLGGTGEGSWGATVVTLRVATDASSE